LYNTSIPRWEAYTFHHHHHLHLPDFSHANVSLFCFLSKGEKGAAYACTSRRLAPIFASSCVCMCGRRFIGEGAALLFSFFFGSVVLHKTHVLCCAVLDVERY
jgi:hypothetical protein